MLSLFFSIKTQLVSSLRTLQMLEAIAHVSEPILVYRHALTNYTVLYDTQYIHKQLMNKMIFK